MRKKIKLAILGCGNMGEAILKGILAKKVCASGDIFVSDKVEAKAKKLVSKYKVKYSPNQKAAKRADVVLVAVKPQNAGELFGEINSAIKKNVLIISILAGYKIARIEKFFGKKVAVSRIMPNMPAFVGEAISAISYNKNVSALQRKIVENLFSSIGIIVEVGENKLNAITALTGSGPAYFFYFIESFIHSAMHLGFKEKEAIDLMVQTMKGSAAVLEELEEHPGLMRTRVTSKGGTTEAAIKVFEKRHLKKIIHEAVLAAEKRARELSGG